MSVTKTVCDVDIVVTVGGCDNWTPEDKSDFVLVDTKIAGENRESFYQRFLDVDNIDNPAKVRVGYYPKVSGGKETANISVRHESSIKIEDSVSGLITYEPFVITIAVAGPGRTGGLDATYVRQALENAMSWYLPWNSALLNETALDLLKFGVTNTLNTLTD